MRYPAQRVVDAQGRWGWIAAALSESVSEAERQSAAPTERCSRGASIHAGPATGRRVASVAIVIRRLRGRCGGCCASRSAASRSVRRSAHRSREGEYRPRATEWCARRGRLMLAACFALLTSWVETRWLLSGRSNDAQGTVRDRADANRAVIELFDHDSTSNQQVTWGLICMVVNAGSTAEPARARSRRKKRTNHEHGDRSAGTKCMFVLYGCYSQMLCEFGVQENEAMIR